MSLNLNGNVTGIYLGSAKADAVYLGNVKVFEDTPPQETVTIGGRAYPVVTIGTQKWTAENLDFKASGITIGPSGSPKTKAAWYYDNDEATYGVNGNKYGLLYNWYAVKYLNDNRASLFPGWHVPTKAEWETLISFAGDSSTAATKLKSTTGWSSGNGTDDFGFSAFPAGFKNGTRFVNVGSNAYFWTISTYADTHAYYMEVGNDVRSSYWSKTDAMSVRLVKDT